MEAVESPPIDSENFTKEYLKDLLTQAQLENTNLTNKLAIVHELLRRYKLNEATELNKQLKDVLSQIKIMKENSDIQTKTIILQKEEIEKLKDQIQNFESPILLSEQKSQKTFEKNQEELETYKTLLKKYQEELKSLKTQLSKSESMSSKCNIFKTENEQLKLKLERKDEPVQSATFRHSSLSKKVEVLAKEKKLLEEKIIELETDKRKLLEKWQNSLSKAKNEDQAKSKLREVEETLEQEKNRSNKFRTKLKEISKKYEDLKETFDREKNYSSELTSSFKSLHVQYKILQDENQMLDKLNQELSIKLHTSNPENLEKPKKADFQKTLSSLQQELAKSQDQLRKKNQELIDLELKVTQNTPRGTSGFESTHEQLFSQKYENLLEKFNKLQSEKTQIQNLYVMASSLISEKNQKVQELTHKIFEFEEKILGHKNCETLKGHSISNTAMSRVTLTL